MQWDCVPRFCRKPRYVPPQVPHFKRNTARRCTSRWAKKERSPLNDAVYRRKKRTEDGSAVNIIDSQLIVTRRRLQEDSFWPPNKQQLMLEAKSKKLTRVAEDVGSQAVVRFVPPGPRRARGLAVGVVLRVVGNAKYVAVHRGRPSKGFCTGRLLHDIFVLPIDAVWLAS